MEPERIEPAVLAVELYREEVLYRRRNWLMAAAALGCSIIGALAVIAAMRYAPHWFSPSPRSDALTATVPKNTNPAQVLYTETKDPEPLPDKVGSIASSGTRQPPQRGPESAVPFNPFSGAIISPSEMPEGWEPGQPNPAVATGDKEPVEPKIAKDGAVLITAKSSSSNAESEASSVAAALQGAGASVRIAPHYNLAGSVVGVQLMATLPASSVESALARLSSAGVGGADKWSGTVGSRSGRVSGILAARISELKSKEVALLEKYEADATEVAVVREEIQKLTQGLGMVRSAKSPGVAVILIGIGSL